MAAEAMAAEAATQKFERIGMTSMCHRGPWDPPYELASWWHLRNRAAEQEAALAVRPSCGARAAALSQALREHDRNAVVSELKTPLPPLRRNAGAATITLRFRRLSGEVVVLPRVDPRADTVGDLKQRLQVIDSVGMPPEAMRMVYDHKRLSDEQTPAEIGLPDGAEVALKLEACIGLSAQAIVACRSRSARSRNVTVETVAFGDDAKLYPKSAITVSVYSNTTYAELVEAAANVAVARRVSWPKTWWIRPCVGEVPTPEIGLERTNLSPYAAVFILYAVE